METKYEMVKQHEKGTTIKDLSKKFVTSALIVATILKDKEKILTQVKEAQPLNSTWIWTKDVKEETFNGVYQWSNTILASESSCHLH